MIERRWVFHNMADDDVDDDVYPELEGSYHEDDAEIRDLGTSNSNGSSEWLVNAHDYMINADQNYTRHWKYLLGFSLTFSNQGRISGNNPFKYSRED